MLSIIVSIIAILSISLNIMQCIYIRDVYNQINFINNHETNKVITKRFSLKGTNMLIAKLNEMLSINRKMVQEYKLKEEALKEAITNISHDIRTPLTSLDGYFQLLLEATSEVEQERYMGIIQKRIEKLKHLLEDMFTYMKVQDESYRLYLEPCNITKIVCENLFLYYENFKVKGIEPKIDIPEKPIVIEGNISVLNRVIDNLINNSLNHGNDYIGVTLLDEGDFVKLIFENDIEDEDNIDIDNIFNRFYKQDKARTVSSTGLGLTIVKELVDAMDGKIVANISKGIFSIEISFMKENC